MSKSSFVLRALNILGLEEVLKLSEVLNVKRVPLKKAAGEELIVWDDAADKQPKRSVSEPSEARVLEFPKKTIQDMPSLPEEGKKEEEGGNIMSSDLLLWQREVTRNTGETIQKLDAFKGYKKSTEMYVVKESSLDGKDKIRFASTNGVLVNKKQA